VRKKLLTLPLLVSLVLASGGAGAVGLGQIEVQSRLNQPLVAEIPLLQVGPADLDRLHVRLASPDAFARVGLDRPASLAANLQFEIATNPRGQPVVRVTTPSRVNDPFVSFLLEVEWGAGRLVREYNILLDPPYMAPATRVQVAPATTSPPPAQVPPAVVDRPAPAPEPPPRPEPRPEPARPAPEAPVADVPAPSRPAPQPVQPLPPQPRPAGGTFTVATGQTLSGIAGRERDPDVSVNQMMIALLRANPDAFIDGNINLLRAGAVMRLPSREDVLAVRVAEANAIVAEHAATWEARRPPVPQPAESPAATAPRREVASAAEARLEITPPAGEADQPGAQTGAAQAGEGTQLRVELSQTQEELATREAEVQDLRARLDALEELSEQQSRMIELRNDEVLALQQQLEQAREQAGESPPPGRAAQGPWYAHPLTLGGLLLLVIGALVWLFTRRRPDTVEVRPGAGRSARAGSLAASIEAARGAGPAAGAASEDLAGDEPAEPVVEPAEPDAPAPAPVSDHAPSDAPVHPFPRPGQSWQGVPVVVEDESPEDTAAASGEPATAPGDEGFFEAGDDVGEGFFQAETREDAGDGLEAEDSDGPGIEDGLAIDLDDGEGDAVSTKLELARAYVDIGDVEGARSMLQEVVAEGTDEQKAEAQALLDSLG